MNNKIFAGATLVYILIVSSVAFAVVPQTIPVQGILTDTSGVALDGAYDVAFSLYDAKQGGTPLWTDTFTDMDVEGGFFTAYLGSLKVLDFASLFASSELWLGVRVEADMEMPRIHLASVPFAQEAEVCSQLGSLTEAAINSKFTDLSAATNWSDISGIPADIADGDQGFTTEAQLTALLNNNYAAANHNHAGTYAPASHNHASEYAPVTHTHTGYSPTTHNHDTAYAPLSHGHSDLQKRVSGACPDGQSIRSITSAGEVTCENDDNTTYQAGTGLDISGTTFVVDPTDFMARPKLEINTSTPAIISANGTLVSSSIAVPVSGRVIVTASMTGQGLLADGTSGYMTISTSSTAAADSGNAARFSMPPVTNGAGMGLLYISDVIAVSAGTTSFYWRAKTNNSVVNSVTYARMTLVFIPD